MQKDKFLMKLKETLKYCTFKEKNWKGHDRNAICWAFYCVNDDKKIDPRNLQVMRCLLCYNNLVHARNPNIKKRKGLITYYKTYVITTLKKHVDSDHVT